MFRLQQLYKDTVRGELQKRFNFKNPMQIPGLTKIVINMGVGIEGKEVDAAVEQLALIAGQRPVITRAKKSISTFKLREGMPVGCKVTLRGEKMYEFLERLIFIALPRVRDFRGLSGKSFDGRGNFSLGLKEQIIFPEINYDQVDKVRGMDIVICTTAANNAEAKALLEGFRMPFYN